MREILRKRYPGLAKRQSAGSPMASIRLFCLECMGGSLGEVKACTADECPLFPLRLGRRIRTRNGTNASRTPPSFQKRAVEGVPV